MFSVAHFSLPTFQIEEVEFHVAFLFWNKIISVTEWLTPTTTRGVGRDTHTEGCGHIHRISVWGIEALHWRTVSEPPGPATAPLYPTRHLCCFPCCPTLLSSHSVKLQHAGDKGKREIGNSTFAGSTTLSYKYPIIPEIVIFTLNHIIYR